MKTKEKIIQAATQLFCENGYERTSMDLIANNVGIKKPALYYYFKSKEVLLYTVFDCLLGEIEENLLSGLTSELSFKEKMKYLFGSVQRMIHYKLYGSKFEYDEYLKFMYFFLEAILHFPDLKKRMNQCYQTAIKKIEFLFMEAAGKGIIRNDLDYKNLAFELCSLFEGVNILYMYNPDLDLVEEAEKIYDNYMKLLAK